MFDIGIIGGMGPAATAELFKRVVLYTLADKDQEHIKMCILNDPIIPDRTEYILNNGESPLFEILKNVDIVKKLGCKYFAIPCNTSHYFFQKFEKIEGITFINMVRETCKYATTLYPDKSICVLATLGTIGGDVYKKIGGDLGKIMYPSDRINDYVMRVIRSIKAGNSNLELLTEEILRLLKGEFDFNNTVFVLACTELSLLLPYATGYFIDAMDVLAGMIVIKSKKKINKDNFKLNYKYFDNIN